MELDHFSHQHPLIFHSKLGTHGEVLCSGCEESISGPYYSCNPCDFILHKKCAELPWEIKCHLHSKHPLVLRAKTPPNTRCVCDLCKRTCKGFVYRCDLCDFDLDIHCVFPSRQFDGYLFYREMVLKHFSHPHHLIFTKELENVSERVVCYACEQCILGPSYSCYECNFTLHTKCAELPREMMSRLHPEHPLVLLAKPPSRYIGRCSCDLCSRTCKSFVYHCDLCNFDADVKCAFPWTFEASSGGVELEHFSHPHPLIFDEEWEYDGELGFCSGCGEHMLGPSYSCTHCNFMLHKKCAELPQEIKCHLHSEHLLVLLDKPPPRYRGSYLCDLCYKSHKGFVYHCDLCSFDLDIKCVFPQCISDADSELHQFIGLLNSVPLKSSSFTCNACGTSGGHCPYLCTKCLLMVHRECISLPRTMNLSVHHHPVSHTYFIKEDEYGNSNCGICQIRVKADYGGYGCGNCNFVAHVSCAMGNVAGSKVQYSRPSTAPANNLLESTSSSICEVRLGEEKRVAEIKHFSHQHDLILFDEANDNKHCDGCRLPISTPFYGCTHCDFFLDKACIELPNEKLFLNGGLPLILHTKAPTVDGLYRCDACYQYCNGFIYKADEIDIKFDIECSKLISYTIKHEGHHQHPLLFEPKNENRRCDACNEGGWPFLFTCVGCNFSLDFRCASLPNKATHKYDRHPLVLTYHPVDDGSGEFVCDVCGCERDPKLWLYYCAECKFAAHPKCVLGKNPLVKLRGTHSYDIHHHPLSLVQKRVKFPPCHSCGMACDDLALECTIPECNFIIHRKKDYCLSKSTGRIESHSC